MSSREKFEQVMKEKFDNLIDYRVCKNGDGEYMAWDMQVAWFAWQAATNAMEAKCAALAAELSQAKSVVSECREYFIAGIMNRIRPTNEGYLHMRCDTLGDETPSHDAFLDELRAHGVDMMVDQCESDIVFIEPEDEEHYTLMIEHAKEFAAQLRKGESA